MTDPAAKPAVLLADIGGTNSRFALAGADGRPAHTLIIENDSVAESRRRRSRVISPRPVRARARRCSRSQAPLEGEEVALTNRAWRFRPGELARRFGFAKLRLVNDFEAIAWALTRLTAADAHPLGPPLPARPGVRAVLGPGTGLGVAALVPVDGRWHVLASEGGHASFGPQTLDELEIFAALLHEHGSISAETILSGPGLPRLLRAVDPRSQVLTPEAVVAAALAGDAAALVTVQLFVQLLGRFAGGLALTFKAVGGVYIAGGVASRLGKLLDARGVPRGLRRASALSVAAGLDPDMDDDPQRAGAARLRGAGGRAR